MRMCLEQIKSKEYNSANAVAFDEHLLVQGKDNSIKQYLALIWRIIVNYGIRAELLRQDSNTGSKTHPQKDNNIEKKEEPVKRSRKRNTPEQMLRDWCNSLLSQELQITNFTKDWSNGKVLLCLSNQAFKKRHRIKPQDAEQMSDKELLQNVLQLNETHLHIPQCLDVNALINAPNKEAVMTYVSLLRTAMDTHDHQDESDDDEFDQHIQNVSDVSAHLDDYAPDLIEEALMVTMSAQNSAINEDEDHECKDDVDFVEDDAPDLDETDESDEDLNTELNIEKEHEEEPQHNADDMDAMDDNAPDIMDTEDEILWISDSEGEGDPNRKGNEGEDSDHLSAQHETAGGDYESDSDDEMEEDTSPNNVDLCILCDVTNGMKSWFDEIKNGIRRIVHDLRNTFGIGKLRLSFIGYRDWDDDENNSGEKRIEKLPFTKQIVKFESFVEIIKAVGGGDAAEDVLGGIQETLDLNWKAPIRVLYHICDAPAHGTMYHEYFERIKKEQQSLHDHMSFLDEISGEDTDSDDANENKETDDVVEEQLQRDAYDKWPNKHPKDPNHEDLFSELQRKGIQYYIGTQTHFTDKMLNVFKTYCDSIEYKLTTMDLMNARRFLPTLIAAVEDAVRVKIPPENADIPDLNVHDLLRKKVHFQVNCGIDFGTAGSGFAYSLPGKNEVYTDQNWGGSGRHVDVKTKTNILLDAQGNCIAFGDDATHKYTHTDTDDLFFERFKMALYEEREDDMEQKEDIAQYLTATNGKQLPSRKVLQEAIRFMKDHAMRNLREKVNSKLQIQDVQWILTVPAIWSDKAKSVMKTAAIGAGMIDEDIAGQLVIAYEPDCASLSILHEINEEARARAAPNVQIESYFEPGDKLLLCDLGGGTADIACHEIDENERIRQIVAPSGGAWGSTYVDQNFMELLEEIFGGACMEEFRTTYPSAYVELLQSFRNAKKTYKMKDKPKVKRSAFHSTFHNVKLPFDLLDFIENCQEIVKQFTVFDTAGLIRLNEDCLEVSYTIWNYLFDKVVDRIIAHCKTLLDLAEMDGCKFLCLVGGFSQSKHLQYKMYRNFGTKSDYNVLIFTPKRPILSVVDGAARMGLNPDFISGRTIGKTYGIAIQKDLDEFRALYPQSQWEKVIPKKRIGQRRIYDNQIIRNKQVVNGVFLPFVRRNALIKNNDKPIVHWVEPANVEANKVSIKLYDSFECDPMFVEDDREANRIEIELSDALKQKEEAIPIIFIFNDTTIRVFVYVVDDDGKKQTKEVCIDFDVIQ